MERAQSISCVDGMLVGIMECVNQSVRIVNYKMHTFTRMLC